MYEIVNCNIPIYKYHDGSLNVQSENNCCKSVIQEHLECSRENIQTSTDISQLPKLNHEYYIDVHDYINLENDSQASYLKF